MSSSDLQYQSGFGNEFATEALAGALPLGQNSPQKNPFGLYGEQLTGSAFTAARGVTRWSWTYRIRPSVLHDPFREMPTGLLRSGPFNDAPPTPNQMRWAPLPVPAQSTDFLKGIITMGGNGEPALQTGVAIHLYAANASMQDCFFYNADGEMLIVPQLGKLRFHTEMGILEITPGEVCVIPRGVRFRVELLEPAARGYICENYGQYLRLPELGVIGTSGLANARDFLAPVASYEDREGDFRLVAKFGGGLWEAAIDHSPLDVVAWHGNLTPYKYDLAKFNCINTVTWDHPDPSIYCALLSPSAIPGTANMELSVFGPRWSVADHTFRPPPFHRNVASEFMGLIYGQYIGKTEGFVPGCASLHNCMSGHGPDAEAFERGVSAQPKPEYLGNTMAFMFETQLQIRLTQFALQTDLVERSYYTHWQGIKKQFKPQE